ncbi:Mitochondrial fission 1 protein A [Trifolium repens]|nr:Mitochondrial fission 1 protein A [Trifolium repens]
MSELKLQSQFLQIAPDWRHALTLKEAIEERITKDGVIGIGIVATAATAAVGLIATGIETSVSRKRMVL